MIARDSWVTFVYPGYPPCIVFLACDMWTMVETAFNLIFIPVFYHLFGFLFFVP